MEVRVLFTLQNVPIVQRLELSAVNRMILVQIQLGTQMALWRNWQHASVLETDVFTDV